jgi:hypothetical protein
MLSGGSALRAHPRTPALDTAEPCLAGSSPGLPYSTHIPYLHA